MSDCVLWEGAVNAKGYGQRRHGGKRKYVHRIAWEEVHGPIPPGMTVDHLCFVTRCLNTEHMELVTRAENTRRAAARRAASGRCRRGHERSHSYVSSSGTVICRVCRNTAKRKYERRLRAEYRESCRTGRVAS